MLDRNWKTDMSPLTYPMAQRRLLQTMLLICLLLVAGAGWAAQVAGTVVHLSGPLLAKKAGGAVRILSQRSEVESGDTLVTEKNTYAMIKFIDNSEITLKPSTTFKVEGFAFDADKPEQDQASFNLVKGGLRSVTGMLGKRNKEKFSMKTPGATIGIRGTTFIADLVMPGAPGQRPPGLYTHVLEGMIALKNDGGAQNFSAGQFGFTPGFSSPPVIVPNNPGIQFAPPPAFNSAATGDGAPPPAANAGGVDCEVR